MAVILRHQQTRNEETRDHEEDHDPEVGIISYLQIDGFKATRTAEVAEDYQENRERSQTVQRT